MRRLSDQRLQLSPEPPYTEPHNTWVANKPGTLLVVPVGDLAQQMLLNLCYMLQDGLVLHDDINRWPVPGIEAYADPVDVNNVWPLTFAEQRWLAELTTELATNCYARTFMLQAMGLDRWMFNGLDAASVLGASGERDAPGLGFRYDTDETWPYPDTTGLSGVMEGYCPPDYPNMCTAVEAVHQRKFGPGGPFHPNTPGPCRHSRRVRSATVPYSERFRECVALQAQHVLDTFGKFPGTVPSIFTIMYLQGHHLDLGFYDHCFDPGAYLQNHAQQLARWQPNTP